MTDRQTCSPTSRRSRRGVALPVIGLPLLLAACGSPTSQVRTGSVSSSSTTTTVGSASTTATDTTTGASSSASGAGSASSSSSTSTGPGAPGIDVVHIVQSPAGTSIRTVTPGGGPTRLVATLPSSAAFLGAGHGITAFGDAVAHHLVFVDLASGHQTTVAGDATFSGAFSPDGSRFAYIQSDPSNPGAGVKLATVDPHAGGSPTIVRTYSSGPVTAPEVWTPEGIEGPTVVPFSDAGPQGVARIDPGTGSTTSSSHPPGNYADTACPDGSHAAVTAHSSGLGDEGDQQGPGPQGPPNTLATLTIGAGSSTELLREAHHAISVFQCLKDPGILLVYDDTAAGGFAGISMSPDFGLFLVNGTHRTQLAKLDAKYDAGVVYQDGVTVAAEQIDSSGAHLLELASGKSPITLDTVPGGQSGEVLLVPTS